VPRWADLPPRGRLEPSNLCLVWRTGLGWEQGDHAWESLPEGGKAEED
jgi:hypothetical protein